MVVARRLPGDFGGTTFSSDEVEDSSSSSSGGGWVIVELLLTGCDLVVVMVDDTALDLELDAVVFVVLTAALLLMGRDSKEEGLAGAELDLVGLTGVISILNVSGGVGTSVEFTRSVSMLSSLSSSKCPS
jgi:hypothetical protein